MEAVTRDIIKAYFSYCNKTKKPHLSLNIMNTSIVYFHGLTFLNSICSFFSTIFHFQHNNDKVIEFMFVINCV